MKLFFSFIAISIYWGSFGQNVLDNDTTVYYLKAKLIKVDPPPPPCGTMAWALAQKFQVIKSNNARLKPNSIIFLILRCPELIRSSFFKENNIYEIKISQTSGTPVDYTVINAHIKEKLASFWIKGFIPPDKN